MAKSGQTTVEAMGIKVTIYPELLDDIEVLELIADADENNASALMKLIRLIFGDQWQKIKDGLRGENGIAKVSDVMEFLKLVLEDVNLKN